LGRNMKAMGNIFMESLVAREWDARSLWGMRGGVALGTAGADPGGLIRKVTKNEPGPKRKKTRYANRIDDLKNSVGERAHQEVCRSSRRKRVWVLGMGGDWGSKHKGREVKEEKRNKKKNW